MKEGFDARVPLSMSKSGEGASGVCLLLPGTFLNPPYARSASLTLGLHIYAIKNNWLSVQYR